MKIKLKNITVRDVFNGYKNDDEEGVVGYGGKLNIRPKYQREYVYEEKERDLVIDTVRKGFPLNVMYWVKNNDNSFEVMDGQQRTISICKFIAGNFSVEIDGNPYYFHTLKKEDKKQAEKILDYKLMVYFCEGDDKEKLDWYKTINIAGLVLKPQELKNAVYTGDWLTDAKKHFSKTGCPAHGLAEKFMTGTPIRQDYLETVLRWISNDNIVQYMADNQLKPNAKELWKYFNDVIEWVKNIFTEYRNEMKGIEWGTLYNKYKKGTYNADEIEKKILELIDDNEVQTIKGIYLYLLTGEEKHLSLREFDDKIKRKFYEKQKGICPHCKKEKKDNKYELNEMEADHIIAWHDGGKTVEDNCQMLCKLHNRTKSGK